MFSSEFRYYAEKSQEFKIKEALNMKAVTPVSLLRCFMVICFQRTTLPAPQITRKQEKKVIPIWPGLAVDDRDSTERPSLRKTRCVGGIWVSGRLQGPTDTITDTVRRLHSTALTNTLLLFLLFYERCRPEERDRADFPDSDNISNQASKNHLTNHPAGQQKAARLHSLSHSSWVHGLLHYAAESLWWGFKEIWKALIWFVLNVDCKGWYVD